MSRVVTKYGKNRRIVRKLLLVIGLAEFLGLGAWGCLKNETKGLVARFGFSALVFASRSIPPNSGSLAAPDAFLPGGNLVLLDPATPGGKLFDLTAMKEGDVLGLDVTPDGKSVVASIRTGLNDRYHLYLIDLEAVRKAGGCFTDNGDLVPACARITFGPTDDTRPFFLRDGRIAFFRSDPDGPVDFHKRGRARVLYAIKPDGCDLKRLDMGPGHGMGASALPEGWLHLVRFTEREGTGKFVPFEIDLSGNRGEVPDTSQASSQSIPMNPVQDTDGRWVAACVPASGTWGAGTLCEHKNNGWNGIVKEMPAGDGCTSKGRIRDPYPLPDGRFLVTYVHVPAGCSNYQDADLGRIPDIGIAILNPVFGELRPVFNQPAAAEMFPRPVMVRPWYDPNAEPEPDETCEQKGVVFQGFIDKDLIDSGAVGIRVIQALSGEVAPWAMELGGLPGGAICGGPAENQVLLDHWVAPIFEDGSFRFVAPEQVPLRIKVIDRYGAALATDPIWRGGVDCEVRSCNGCHSNQGVVEGFDGSFAAALDPHRLDAPEDRKVSYNFRTDIQPILDRSCAVSGCHDQQTAVGNYATLTGQLRGIRLDGEISGRTTAGYENLLWLDQRRDSLTGKIIEQRRAFVVPGWARESRLLQRLGVPCRYDCEQGAAWAPWALGVGETHPEDQPSWNGELTPEERWRLVEWIEMGASFHGLGAEP